MQRVVLLLAILLICEVTATALLGYVDYFPPNFRADFLLGRDAYFFGPYQWAFYAHIISGPFALLAGLVLLSESVRWRFPAWHRRLGRVQVMCVLLLVVPSGLWMARYAFAGPIAGVGFASLAVVTGLCAAMGWRAAVGRRFADHRHWMLWCFVLLCSSVVLRVIGGLSEVLGVESTYPFAAWISWLLPLVVLEAMWVCRQFPRLRLS